MDCPVVAVFCGSAGGITGEVEVPGEITIVQILHVPEIPADLQQMLARDPADGSHQAPGVIRERIALLADAEVPADAVLREKRNSFDGRHALESICADVSGRGACAPRRIVGDLQIVAVISQAARPEWCSAPNKWVSLIIAFVNVFPTVLFTTGCAVGCMLCESLMLKRPVSVFLFAESLIDSDHPLVSVQDVRAGVDVVVAADIRVGRGQKYLRVRGHRRVDPAGRDDIAGERRPGSHAIHRRRAVGVVDHRSRLAEDSPATCRRKAAPLSGRSTGWPGPG